jgi:hypothetical protein
MTSPRLRDVMPIADRGADTPLEFAWSLKGHSEKKPAGVTPSAFSFGCRPPPVPPNLGVDRDEQYQVVMGTDARGQPPEIFRRADPAL